ncbi:MAG: hypothetical protein IKY90_01065 [Oscillospiraceae bacterium]|nr:hypothetical protein [Oscillospiraceae bacterium]MBR5873306.1 hypothetical protein [Oscillospiraceae bacterium]
MKIVINPFDKDSINKALKQVRAYQKDFKKKEQEFIKRLAEIGVSVATAGFEAAAYDGTKDVSVRMERRGNKVAVIAEGETVGFIEFGTGKFNPEYNSAGLEYTPPPHGSYGQGKGKQKSWGYYGDPGTNGKVVTNSKGRDVVITKGNPPAEAMLAARNEMISKVTQIAREVWR